MAAASVEPLPLYRPRDPQASDLWRLLDRHFATFQQVYDERFQAKYGFWRPVVERSRDGLSQVRRSAPGLRPRPLPGLPSRDVRRLFLQAALHLPLLPPETGPADRHPRGRRGLFSRRAPASGPDHPQTPAAAHPLRSQAAGQALLAAPGRASRPKSAALLGRDDVLPGMVAAIQTYGELLHWHPHIHALVTCGAFTPEGEFLELPEFDMERLQAAWQEAVFALYLAEGKIEPEVVENMRTWPHSGFTSTSRCSCRRATGRASSV